jgi:hypothetical protein
MATNQSEQKADAAIVFETRPVDDGAKLSLIWLKAYGAGAIAVNGPDSAEFWKPFSDPGKFDALPAIWKESGVTIRRIPQRSASLAHVVPESAIVQYPPKIPEDTAAAARYVRALDDPAMPEAPLAWSGREHMRIHARLAAGQVISVQEGYHPGWRATVNGKPRELFKDGLGLMWFRPGGTGECDIALDYNGGWEWWICHIVSYLTIAGVLTGLVIALRNQVRHRH